MAADAFETVEDVGAPDADAVDPADAVDVDVDFGERVEYSQASNRKQVSRDVEARIRAMLGARLRGR